MNICRITLTLSLPFNLENKSNKGYQVKLECLKYLNRLVEVVRFKTKKYWLLPVVEHEILYADISDFIHDSGKKKEGYVDMSEVSMLNLPMLAESDVLPEIQHLLKSGERINYSDSLILDSYYYIFLGKYNESVITSNFALEMFILESLKEILQFRYASETELEHALHNVLEKNLRYTFRKNFMGGKDHLTLMKDSDIYRKFDTARDFRANVLHNGLEPNRSDAELNLTCIYDVNNYLIQNATNYGANVIKRAKRKK